MPSKSVPETFIRGVPSDRVASMWKCGSTKGGATSQPFASITSLASAAIPPSTVVIFPSLTGDIHAGSPVGQCGVLEDQIEHGRSYRWPLNHGVSKARG